MNEFWNSSQQTWQTLTPESQDGVRVAGILVGALIIAQMIGWLVGRKLRAAQFDASFRRPWVPPPTVEHSDSPTLTPTRFVVFFVRLTIWGVGVWGVARLYNWTELTRGLEWFAGRAWSFVAVTLAALFVSRQFSAKVVEVVQTSPLKPKLDEWLPPTGVRESRVSGAALIVCFLIDGIVLLLLSLVAVDLMGWTLTGSALATTWQLLLHVASAGIALLIGWWGARWVRTQVVDTPASSPARVGYYTGIGVMGGATLLAILLLAGTYPTYFGLLLLLLFILLLWPVQAYLPDIYAGLMLKMQKVKEVKLDDGVYRLGAVGFIQTPLMYNEETKVRRNRVILDAHLANPVETKTEEKLEEAGKP
jgi:hypothetical protein